MQSCHGCHPPGGSLTGWDGLGADAGAEESLRREDLEDAGIAGASDDVYRNPPTKNIRKNNDRSWE